MKVLVLSDSHGNLTNMVRAVEAESPHMIVHLGDGETVDLILDPLEEEKFL